MKKEYFELIRGFILANNHDVKEVVHDSEDCFVLVTDNDNLNHSLVIDNAISYCQQSFNELEIFNAAIFAGYPVPGESYTLPLTTEYQDALNRAKNAFEVAELPDEYLVAIDDISNESHMVSVAKFREILKGYTRYYLGLRAQLKS